MCDYFNHDDTWFRGMADQQKAGNCFSRGDHCQEASLLQLYTLRLDLIPEC